MDSVKEIEVLVDVAVLGKQIDEFAKSDVGQYILEKAREEQAQGYEKLKTLPFNAADDIRLAQNQVWRAESLTNWVNQAIMAGIRATQVLESREDD